MSRSEAAKIWRSGVSLMSGSLKNCGFPETLTGTENDAPLSVERRNSTFCWGAGRSRLNVLYHRATSMLPRESSVAWLVLQGPEALERSTGEENVSPWSVEREKRTVHAWPLPRS